MVAYAEGTAGRGDDGYNILFGYGRFDSYADHPRIYVPFGDTTTSAAGRYQILARTWDGVRGRLGLPDFSPASQDAAAIELIRERGALNDVRAGRVTTAIEKVRKVWASLPGAGYGQPERRLSSLLDAYASAGGSMEHQA
nr:glycoside hydrolase family 104 protein [Diaphorobacter nitroreducens]